MLGMYLGVEIGGTKLQVGVCDGRGGLRYLVRTPVARALGRRGILRQLEQIVPVLLTGSGVKRIGVGFGGPVDVGRGRAVTSFQIAGWDGFRLGEWFRKRFGLPVIVANDQNCAALAEAICGAGRGKRSVFYVTVGTGVGGGLVVDRKLYDGKFGAAEIGHMQLPFKGKWRTVESLASGLAIERGVSTVAESGRFMGMAIANAIALLNPEIVIVGGGVTQAGEKFFRPLRQTVERLVFPPFRHNFKIVRPKLGPAVVVVGAALLAAQTGRKG